MASRVILNLIRHEVARRVLQRQPPEAVAVDMELSTAYVKRVLNHPEFKAILEDLRQKAYLPLDTRIASSYSNLRDRINVEAAASFKRLTFLQDNAASEQVRLHASQDVLDRAGYTRKTELDVKIIHFDEVKGQELLLALRKQQEGKLLLGGKALMELAKAPEELEHHPIIVHKRTYGTDEQNS